MPRRLTPRNLVSSLAVVAAAAVIYWLGHRGQTSALPGDDDYLRYHNQTFHAVAVVDGDTLDLDIPDGQHKHTRVRLWGVDSPHNPSAGADAVLAAIQGGVMLGLNN